MPKRHNNTSLNNTHRKKKLTEGAAKNYITRTRALRKLQVSLKDFRRLCILKGIYPRPPKKKLVKKYGTKTTFYHVKDILFLSHEPVLKKFRQMKIYVRKLATAKNRKDEFKAKMLKGNKPQFVFDHLVRERYPSFDDALQDLDDPLSMIHLFSILPSGLNKELTGKRISKIQRLRDETQAWLVNAGCIRKAFVSIKGTYIEVNIQGQKVIFVIPHKFVHETPRDVDYNVMVTFLDFYETLLKFINFRLYKSVGLHYPPLVDKTLDTAGLTFRRMKLETIEQAEDGLKAAESSEAEPKKIDNLSEILDKVDGTEDPQQEETIEKEEALNDFKEADTEDKTSPSEDRGDLFKNLHFLLNRETPQDNLELIIRACGGSTVRLQFCKDKSDSKITHQIVDRPVKADSMISSRDYVQPQWVFDSLNAGTLLPTHPYRPNVPPPPHLSPFVDNSKSSYIPKQALVTQSWIDGKPLPEEEKTEEAKEEKDSVQDEEEEKEEKDDSMKQMQKSVLSGKKRRLMKAMEMGNAKRDAAAEKLRSKRRKLDEQESSKK